MKKGKTLLLSILIVLLFWGLTLTPAFAANMKAVPSEQKLTINGTVVNNIPVYNINGYNYFKLRDIAYYLDYEVEYIQSANAIAIMRGGHGVNAGVSKGKATTTVYGVSSSQRVFIDTMDYSNQLHPVNIGGNNYFQLRELAQYAAYGVQFDSASNSILVNSNYNYSKDGLTSPKADGWKDKLSASLAADKETVKQKAEEAAKTNQQGVNGKIIVTQVNEGMWSYEFIPSTGIWTGQQGDRTYGFVVDSVSDVQQAFASVMDNYPKTLVFFSKQKLKLNYDDLCEPYEITHGLHNRSKAVCYSPFVHEGDGYYEYRVELHYSAAGIVRMYREGVITTLPDKEDMLAGAKEADYSILLNAAKTIERKYGLSQNSSDYEKVYAVYNYLTSETQYDYRQLSLSGNDLSAYVGSVPYPAEINFMLTNKKGVCFEYALTFQALCYIFDIDCYYVSGDVTTSLDGHAWNIVKVNGQWYQVDATWDTNHEPSQYEYFLISDSQMSKDHRQTYSAYHYPSCPTNYKQQNQQQQVTSISLNKSSINLNINETAQLDATIYPSNATDKSITYTSSNSSVASVSNNGTITAVKAGTTTITAKTSNGKTASCTVQVNAAQTQQQNPQQNNQQQNANQQQTAITSISFGQYSTTLEKGKTFQSNITVSPTNAESSNISYSSSDSSIATVSQNGLVTAKNGGVATITATTSNGKRATLRVNVNGENQSVVDEIYSLTNQERRKAGVSTIAYKSEVQAFANQRAYEITSNFSHDGWDKGPIPAAGENATYHNSATGAINNWMNSPGHKANMLDRNHDSMAVGVYCYNGDYYCIQLFYDDDLYGNTGTNNGNTGTNNRNNNVSNGEKPPSSAISYTTDWGYVSVSGRGEFDFHNAEEYIDKMQTILEWDKTQHQLNGVRGFYVGSESIYAINESLYSETNNAWKRFASIYDYQQDGGGLAYVSTPILDWNWIYN